MEEECPVCNAGPDESCDCSLDSDDVSYADLDEFDSDEDECSCYSDEECDICCFLE